MSNLEKYNQIFVDILGVGHDKLDKDLIYQSVAVWDSVGHMQLIGEIEDAFDIMLDTEDIIDFNSYEKGKEIVEKYGVELC